MVKRYKHAADPAPWLAEVAQKRSQDDANFLSKAVTLADHKNSVLMARSLCLADFLMSLGLDSDTLAAALLLPPFQNGLINTHQVSEQLNPEIIKLLQDALQMQSLGKMQHLRQRQDQQVENLRKMLLAMVSDIRAVLIVLAERLCQLHEAKSAEAKEQRRLAQETLDVYAPLANRLGVWQLKWEIEDLCLRYLEPEAYSRIAKFLASRRQERELYLERVLGIVTQLLEEANIQHFQINGRVKHIYSIYKKMMRKGSALEEIYDISALRVLVENIPDCYAVLSLLQDTWPQVLKEFDDYISQPKPNGYRSIHTVLLGPENHFIEVQIRTYQMHQESELGVAAHWQYKEGLARNTGYEAKIALLRQIMAWQQDVTKTDAKSEQQALDLFADIVYVFTPMGDIVDLPKGSTPLDFAYNIHSEVGHRCRGAKINGNIVPLTYQLQTGDRVEILTAKIAAPSRDWLVPRLGYIKTPRARSKAQHWFRVQDGIENVVRGKEIWERELKKSGISERPDAALLAAKFNYKNSDDFFAALATGELKPTTVLNIVKPQVAAPPAPLPITAKPKAAVSADIQILGVNNLLTQNALCCKPLPGDAVIGYITRNRGVSIHRQNCNNIKQIRESKNQDRLVNVSWGEEAAGDYAVDLLLIVNERTGMLRDITTLLATEKINVLGLQTQKTHQANEAEIYITIQINSREQLQKAITLLETVPDVIAARRR